MPIIPTGNVSRIFTGSCPICAWAWNYMFLSTGPTCDVCGHPIALVHQGHIHGIGKCGDSQSLCQGRQFSLCLVPIFKTLYNRHQLSAAGMGVPSGPHVKGYKKIYIGGQLGGSRATSQNFEIDAPVKKVICPICFTMSKLVDKDDDSIQLACCRIRKRTSPKLFEEVERRLLATAPL